MFRGETRFHHPSPFSFMLLSLKTIQLIFLIFFFFFFFFFLLSRPSATDFRQLITHKYKQENAALKCVPWKTKWTNVGI